MENQHMEFPKKSIELSISWPYFVTFMKELLALQGVGSRGVNRIRTDEKRFCRPSP